MTTEAMREDLNAYLETLAPTVRRNVKLIEQDKSEYKQMLHISSNTDIKKFVPVIGLRQAKTEDRTVPRICVAPTLMDCVFGYGAAVYEFQDNASDGKKDSGGFKGGWKIYGFDYDIALQPNKRLVYDAEESNEHWLVGFNKETASYTPHYIGKVFVYCIKLVARDKKKPEELAELFVEIVHKDGMFLWQGKHVAKGFYKISGNLYEHDKLEAAEITAKEYQAAKDVSASLLSASIATPASLRW